MYPQSDHEFGLHGFRQRFSPGQCHHLPAVGHPYQGWCSSIQSHPAAVNSPIVTNVTLSGTDDAFTYIDRADPNTVLLAAISDLTGRWAFGTPTVNTKGSANVDCIGLVSSSGNSAQLQKAAEDAAAAAAAKSRRKTNTIIGVCVALAILIILAVIVGTVLYMRRRKAIQDELEAKEYLDLTAKPFTPYSHLSGATGTEGQVLSINSWVGNSSSPRSPKSPSSGMYTTSSAPFDPYQSVRESSSARPTSGGSSSTSRPGFAKFPVAATRRNAKSMEALGIAPSIDSSAPRPTTGVSDTSSPDPARPALARSETGSGVTEFVIQHEDGGEAVVRELPPPYADRTRQKAREDAGAES